MKHANSGDYDDEHTAAPTPSKQIDPEELQAELQLHSWRASVELRLPQLQDVAHDAAVEVLAAIVAHLAEPSNHTPTSTPSSASRALSTSESNGGKEDDDEAERVREKEIIAQDVPFISLTLEAYNNLMAQCGVAYLGKETVFRSYDLDVDGRIDYRELSLLLHMMGLYSTEDIVRHFSFPLVNNASPSTTLRS